MKNHVKDNEDSSVSQALLQTFISPNEADSNLEAANVVDGLFAISRAINHLADELRRFGFGIEGDIPTTKLGAIENLAKEVSDLGDKLVNND